MKPSECTTKREWDSLWNRKHPDGAGRWSDGPLKGRRNMLEYDEQNGGTVLVTEPEYWTCQTCTGRGYKPEARKPSRRNPSALGFYARPCRACGGTGAIYNGA